MIFLLDSSAILAALLNEPGAERVEEILRKPSSVAISALSLFEVFFAATDQTGSQAHAEKAVQSLKASVGRVLTVTPEIVERATVLRLQASGRLSAVDTLIAATAESIGAVLVCRDAHFAALPPGRPALEILPPKLSA